MDISEIWNPKILKLASFTSTYYHFIEFSIITVLDTLISKSTNWQLRTFIQNNLKSGNGEGTQHFITIVSSVYNVKKEYSKGM